MRRRLFLRGIAAICVVPFTCVNRNANAACRIKLPTRVTVKLPTVMYGEYTHNDLESMGIVFGNETDGGTSVYAILPDGWSIQPTDDPDVTEMKDNKGRLRAEIFRHHELDHWCHIFIFQRYHSRIDRHKGQGMARVVVRDGGKIIHGFCPFDYWSWCEKYDGSGQVFADADRWLDAHFPDHKNCLAYWD